jgi:glycosyltransferase involved in cell wall biosynthesis
MPEPIRVLELRSVRGTGGGPEKTILRGAARSDSTRFAITVCYIRDRRDAIFSIANRADVQGQGLDYVEIPERHSLDPMVLPALRRLIRERQIDIVHAHEYKSDLLAWALAKTTRVIPLATVHGWTGHSNRERRFYYPCDKRLLARYPRLIAVSEEIRTELLRHGARPERVTTILNGIDHQHFRRQPGRSADVRASLGIAPEEIVIGAVGRLEPQKRFDILLRAVAQLRASNLAVRVVIAGDGSERAALEKLVRELALESCCQLTGHCGDVAELHHAFDLLVQSSDYEGAPNAVLEAMALETPVVATDVGGTRELAMHDVHALIVSPNDVRALAEAIRSALETPAATRRRVHAARLRVENDLSFDSRMRRVENIYSELVDVTSLAPAFAGSI